MIVENSLHDRSRYRYQNELQPNQRELCCCVTCSCVWLSPNSFAQRPHPQQGSDCQWSESLEKKCVVIIHARVRAHGRDLSFNQTRKQAPGHEQLYPSRHRDNTIEVRTNLRTSKFAKPRDPDTALAGSGYCLLSPMKLVIRANSETTCQKAGQ